VIFTGPLSNEEKEKEAQEQQRVLELKIKIRNDEIQEDIKRENDRRSRLSTHSLNIDTGSQNIVTKTPEQQHSPNHISPNWPGEFWPKSPGQTVHDDLDQVLLDEAIRLSLIQNSERNQVQNTNDTTETIVEEMQERRSTDDPRTDDSQQNEDVDMTSTPVITLGHQHSTSVEERRGFIDNRNIENEYIDNISQESDEEDLALALALSMGTRST